MEKKLNLLLIDDIYETNISTEEAEQLKPIQKAFMESYIKNKDNISVDLWLTSELKIHLPDRNDAEIEEMSIDIISALKVSEEKQHSLENAIISGRSKESWFANEIQKSSSLMSTHESVAYLQNLDNALTSANTSLYNTITTQAGVINQNLNLDGFIAEQYHAQTFNLNAEATGSSYRAKVLEPNGQRYTKNSVDIVVIDNNGKVVSRYQSKYCKDAKATLKAYNDGDYRGQQLLVPKDQSADISKKHTSVIEAPDGTTSKPLTKSSAKDLQKEAQSGKWNDLNWNEYKTKDLAIGISKQAGQAALMGAAVGVGFNVAQKVWNGEKIDGGEIVETALISSADFGVKAAAAGALKVGAEKGFISVIPKGTPAGTVANIAYVAVENVKIIRKIGTGELTFKEGCEKMEQTTVATIAGIATSTEGAMIGGTIGTIFGPVGAAVGGFIGGTIGYMAGSKVGETIIKEVQKIREVAKNVVKTVWEGTKSVVSGFCDGVKSFVSGFIW